MTTNKPGTVTQQPLYCCTSCYEQCTYPADHLRVNDGECWCDLCWDERRWEFPDQPSWNDLDPYTPSLQTECEKLRKDAKLWGSNHDDIHRRADKEHALAVPDDWRQKAAEWLRKKAEEQHQINIANPEHTRAYPYWEQKVRELNWLQAELLMPAPSHSQHSAWRPIETAPKDGTEVIVRFVLNGDGFVEAKNASFNRGWKRICHSTKSQQYFSFGKVTHWIPIPDLPGRCPSHESEQHNQQTEGK